jgi:hypothetical protein
MFGLAAEQVPAVRRDVPREAGVDELVAKDNRRLEFVIQDDSNRRPADDENGHR